LVIGENLVDCHQIQCERLMKFLPAIASLLSVLGYTLGGNMQVNAAASDGVRCPNGFETQFDAAQKTMRCERSTTQHRPTVCDPASPAHVVYRAVKGRDYCVSAADAVLSAAAIPDSDSRRRAVVCGGDSSDSLRWQVETDAVGERDRCRATRSEWIYPSQQ
jgi:hypothetical protein